MKRARDSLCEIRLRLYRFYKKKKRCYQTIWPDGKILIKCLPQTKKLCPYQRGTFPREKTAVLFFKKCGSSMVAEV